MARFYTVKQASLILGFSTNSIYKFLDEGRLKGARGNAAQGRFKIAHTNLEQFLGSKLPEDALAKALYKHQKLAMNNPSSTNQGTQVSTVLNNFTPPVTNPTHSPIPYTLARILIIIALIGILIDLIINQNYSFTQNGLRLVLLTIIILLTYQYGGVTVSK